jgi:peptide/nickel transport system permease protein
MTRLLLRRIVLGFLTLWVVSVLVFAATQALPGDPARAILGRTATPERLEAVRTQLNLDRPVLEQYAVWFGGVLRGDLGTSLASREPVSELIGKRVGNSALLVLVAGAVAIPLGFALGIAGAVRRDKPLDHGLSLGTLVLAALPEFVIGIVLILLLATGVAQVFPAVSLLSPDEPAWRQLDKVVLPAATLVLAVIPYVTRMVRASMIEVLESEYIEMSRLKGLRERLVVFRHAFPNALVPGIQVTALSLAWLAGGVVVVEFVFRYAGIGEALVNAVANRDLPVVQALALLAATVYVGLNLLADVATILVTPKLRTAIAGREREASA